MERIKEKLLPKGTVYDKEIHTTLTCYKTLKGYDALGIRIDSEKDTEEKEEK